MRMIFGVTVVVAILGLDGWAWSSAAGQARSQADGVAKATLKVEGMTCGGCEVAVRRAAKQVDGVKDVTASAAKGTADVTYDASKTNPEAIAKAITENSGFKASAPKADSSTTSES
jgi:copper chaperone